MSPENRIIDLPPHLKRDILFAEITLKFPAILRISKYLL
jgi:hypothetical protein